MNQLIKTTALASSLLLLSACSSTPFRTPEMGLSEQFAQGALRGNATMHEAASYPISDVSADAWWLAFKDDGLTRLIQSVLTHNNDLAAATLRVQRAQLQAGLSRNARFPQLSGSVGSSYSKDLDTGTSNGRNNNVSLSASWEVDLWNRLGLSEDIARWEAIATTEDREASALALIGTTATLYWNIAYLNQRIVASQASVERTRSTLSLVETQYEAGAVSGLELREAKQSVDSQIANLAALKQQRVASRLSLALLLGGEPWPQSEEPQDLSGVSTPEIDAGIPAELLGRRPDLRAAEWRLRKSLASIDLTRRAFYPGFSLTGSLGSASRSLSDVLQNPIASLGAGLSLPFLRFQQRKLDIAVSETDYEIAATQFRQTLLNALSDVEVSLAARQAWREQVASLTRSLEHAIQIEEIYEVRYQVGATSLRVWLDAQESRRNAEVALAQSRLSQLQNDIALFQALGGSTRQPLAESFTP